MIQTFEISHHLVLILVLKGNVVTECYRKVKE